MDINSGLPRNWNIHDLIKKINLLPNLDLQKEPCLAKIYAQFTKFRSRLIANSMNWCLNEISHSRTGLENALGFVQSLIWALEIFNVALLIIVGYNL